MTTRTAPIALALFALLAAPAPAQEAAQRRPLPIRKVVLYKHGVGYFEREGPVEGDVTIPLTFKTSQMPDVLKSLYAVHTQGTGRVASIVYDSKDPLSKQLADIMVEVPSGSALTTFLQQLKGALVEVTLGAEGVRGHVMGIEPIPTRTEAGVTTRYKVVLLAPDGVIRPLELLDASAVRVLDPALQRDLQRMMEIHARARHADRKVVDLASVGGGARTLRVGYIIEQPIWKTSYRLLFEPGEKPLLQGWAIVENRTDEDWSDVRLSFVAGSPLSFLMDLYTSYYPQRPEVGVPAAEGALSGEAPEEEESDRGEDAKKAGALRARRAPAAPPAPGMAAGSGGGGGGMAEMLRAALAPAAEGVAAGELFSYESKGAVSVKQGQAALVPILLESLEGGERILYYRQDLSPHPQHAYRLRNSSTLTLERGPVTVFEGSTCQGESLLSEVLRPGMTAMLPYAIESATEVVPARTIDDQPVSKTTLVRGVLTFTRTRIHETRYALRERGGQKRVVYCDHPRTPGTELTPAVMPAETLPGHYRFRVELAAGGTATLTVREQQPTQAEVRVQNVGLDQLRLVLQQPTLSEAARQRLGEAARLMGERAQATADHAAAKAERDQTAQDQERVRKTLEAFRNDPKERTLREQYLKRLVESDQKIDELDERGRTLTARVRQLDQQIGDAIATFEG